MVGDEYHHDLDAQDKVDEESSTVMLMLLHMLLSLTMMILPAYGDQYCVSGGTNGSTCHICMPVLAIQSMNLKASLPISPIP